MLKPVTVYGPPVCAHVVQVGAVLDEELDEEAIYVMHRTFDDSGLRRDDKQLYLQGLQVRGLAVLLVCMRITRQGDKQLYLQGLQVRASGAVGCGACTGRVLSMCVQTTRKTVVVNEGLLH